MSLAYILLPLLAQAGAQPDGPAITRDLPDCSEMMTQQAMNRCAALRWEQADADLNAQWRETAAEMRRLDESAMHDDARPGYFDQLLAAQRAWLSYRDNHCASVGYGARGGSLEPLLVANCKADLTLSRTAELRELSEWPR